MLFVDWNKKNKGIESQNREIKQHGRYRTVFYACTSHMKFLCDVIRFFTMAITFDVSHFIILFCGSEEPVGFLHLYRFIEVKGM